MKGIIFTSFQDMIEDALAPEIKVLSRGDDCMTLSYSSPRKLCFLALGLITNAGEYFNTPVTVSHGQCMHSGSTFCELNIVALEGKSG